MNSAGISYQCADHQKKREVKFLEKTQGINDNFKRPFDRNVSKVRSAQVVRVCNMAHIKVDFQGTEIKGK